MLADGSIDLYFSAEATAGAKSNWPDHPTMPELAGVPQLESLARDEEERLIFRTVQTGIADRALVVPPGVPTERVAAIAEAYAATLRDPAFISDAKAAKFDIEPLRGETIQQVVAGVVALPAATVARMKAAMGQD